MHRQKLGAAPHEPEGDVEVAVREIIAGVADDDGTDRPGRERLDFVGCHPALPIELTPGILRREHE